MMNSISISILFSIVLPLAACASHADDVAPDAALATTSVDPSGRFTVHTTWTVAPPAGVAAALAQLTAAADGPEDPSRFLIDHLVDRLDEGWPKTIAQALAPYVAAYVNERIDEVAPQLTSGVRALAAGLDRITRQFGTEEMLAIAADGRAQRTITGVSFTPQSGLFGTAVVEIAPITVETQATLEGDRLAIASHALRLPHGDLVRLGFSHAVIPSVVPGARDLAEALTALVDCDHLGALIAERLGVGSPGLYAQACRLGVTAAAAEIDERLAALAGVPLDLAVAGVARGLDRDRDGSMETIESGTWTGASGTGIFDGGAR